MTLRNLIFLCLICFVPAIVYSQENVIRLQGNLGKEEIKTAQQYLQKARKDNANQLIIEVNSNSGNLHHFLNFVKELYAYKVENQAKIVVYINQNALGPAAIIPFLADDLYISYFVSWGDISLITEDTVPTNILRNSVISLIPSNHPQKNLLTTLASAMSDTSLQVIDDNGWKISKVENHNIISKSGEGLVVNHNQLRDLELISGVISLVEFRRQFLPTPSIGKPVATQALLKAGIDERLAQHIKFDPTGPNTIGLIKVAEKTTQISQATWIYVKNALDYYKKSKPAFIILELNTPGGEVFSAQKISDALKELDTQYNIPVVAFINNWAISAGAMLAYSCRFISVTKDASMGAAEPIQVGQGGQMTTASEKVNSALRADFANRAAFFDRDPNIAEAMVDKDIILVSRYGKIIRLDSEDKIRKTGPEPDEVISAKGKLLTLSTEDMIKYGIADLMLTPAKVEQITPQEEEKGKWPAEKMLLFQLPFFKGIPQATVDHYKMDWKTQFLVLLANPVVSSMLFLGMLLGFYTEMNTPGFGIAGSFALICLALIMISSFALDIANFLEVVLLLVGIIFIALDLVLIPTFGILGIVGVVFFLIGLFGIMLPGIGSVEFEYDTNTFNAAGEVFIQRLAWLCGTLVVGLIMIALLAKYVMPTFSGFRRFILQGHEQTAHEGYIAGADPHMLPQPGAEGEVLATLRPSGKVIIKGKIYDAITGGEFIEKGTPIVVSKLDGSVIVVNVRSEKK